MSNQGHYVAQLSPHLHNEHFDNSAMDTAEDLDSINVNELGNWVTAGQVQSWDTRRYCLQTSLFYFDLQSDKVDVYISVLFSFGYCFHVVDVAVVLFSCTDQTQKLTCHSLLAWLQPVCLMCCECWWLDKSKHVHVTNSLPDSEMQTYNRSTLFKGLWQVRFRCNYTLFCRSVRESSLKNHQIHCAEYSFNTFHRNNNVLF